MVDTGRFLSAERSAHGEPRYDARVKNDWVIRAFNQFRIEVANISGHDLPHVAATPDALDPKRVGTKFISANIKGSGSKSRSPQSFTVREVIAPESARHAGRKTRVAFVGLTQAADHLPAGYRIVDPVEAARSAVQSARKEADFIIVLANLNTTEAIRVAREVAGIDALIAGNGDFFTPPMKINSTSLAFTPFETRMLGELRAYRNQGGVFSIKFRFITLDESVGEDNEALNLTDSASKAHEKAVKTRLAHLNDLLGGSQTRNANGESDLKRSAESGSLFASALRCGECHQAEYAKWINSPHWRATGTILTSDGGEAGCLNCHATETQTSARTAASVRTGVQCEQCHGPGADHSARPKAGYGKIQNMSALCLNCHTDRTSPGFDLKAYWEKIKH